LSEKKDMKVYLFVVMMAGIFLSSSVYAQKTAAPPSKFDAALAKKVGADEHGMRSYVLALLKTGPNDSKITGAERDEVFKGHFANIKRLASEGKLAVAGPFDDPAKVYRGLFILAVSTVEEAKALAGTDPTVKAGVFIVEYIPWYGSASLMLSNELHDKVAAKSF
jgi:uncharacterized protein YciI